MTVTGDTAVRKWEVALSFAGAQRPYVERVAAALKARGVRCFYDGNEQTSLWGKHLVEELEAVYAEHAGAVVVFVSADYAARVWTRWEHRAALSRAVVERREYVLPARFDDTTLPGLAGVATVDLRGRSPEAFADLVAGKLAELGITPPPAAPTPSGTGEVLWGPIPPRNLFFTGRERALDQLHEQLTGSGGAGPAVSVLAGMGGIGKTQLAVEYAHRHATAYRLVWWVTAETSNQTAAGLGSLADALGLPSGEPAERQRRLWAVLAGRSDWLLVYDNVVDPAVLAAILPPRPSGRVLVTSRGRLPRLPTVDVSPFDRVESVALVHRHLPDLPAAAADRLAAAVGDLPLAVDQAGAYLAEAPVSVRGYLRLLAGQPQLVLADATPDHAGLAATVSAARSRLARLQPRAAVLLDQLAFLAPDPIPLAIGHPDPTGPALVLASDAGPKEAAERLRAIVRLALARRTGSTVQVHRLVAALLRARLSPAEYAAVLEQSLHLLATAAPGDPDDPANWPAWATVAPHVQAVTGHLADSGGPLASAEPGPFRSLVERCAWYLYASGQLHPACQLAAATLKRWAGARPGHPHTLRVARTLAAALGGLGEHQEARLLAEDTLARMRRVLGDDHPDTLGSASNFAAHLASLGEHREARRVGEDTLVRRRRVLGDDHPDTLASASNLALALAGLGEYQEARLLGEDTLARMRRVLGDDHPHTLQSAHNLAMWLAQLGEHRAARQLGEDTLARRRRVLGDDHPHTLQSAHNLVGGLPGLAQEQVTKQLAGDTLARMRRVFGDDHPRTLASASDLAVRLAKRGEYREARRLADDTLARMRRVLGDDHLQTLQAAHNLVLTLARLGEHELARQLGEDTLARMRRVLGDDHPDTLASASNLAIELAAVGEHRDARRLGEETLARRRRVLGEDHPHTHTSREFLRWLDTESRK